MTHSLPKTQFFPWAGTSSVLGFGTTSFMSAGSTKERLALLDCAFDYGINHFDTAAYYGFGEAERLLGRSLAGRRDQVTITTKFGIEPSGAVKARWVNLLARRILKLAPFVRKAISRKRGLGRTTGKFTPEIAAASLERSLMALQTDYIDLFLLHEPNLNDARSEPLIEFLESEVQKGRIRAYGCGGEWERIEPIMEAGTPASKWLQFEDNPINRRLGKATAYEANCITFAPFNKALNILVEWLEAHPESKSDWSRQLDLDCSNRSTLASLLQAGSHKRNSAGIVLFSSKSREHIKRAAMVANGDFFSKEQVNLFLDLTAQSCSSTR